MSAVLIVDKVSSGYGKLQVLHSISFKVNAGEIVAFVGANGAGKTTLLRTLNGILRATEGSIVFNGQDITRTRTERMASLGFSHVPENRLCFPDLSVEDNLALGAWSRGDRKDNSLVLELFPRIKERLRQPAGTLSGGEQQMVAIGRALMSNPDLILLDEPSTGLAPRVVTEIMDALKTLAARGKSILLVEQNVKASFRIADSAVLIHRGKVSKTGTPAELVNDPEVQAAYLGRAA